MFKNPFRRQQSEPPSTASGITVILLQRKLERFTTQRLNKAMQQGWGKPFDETTFFAIDLGSEGAVIKMNSTFYSIQHNDSHLGTEELGTRSIPEWAMHGAFSSLRAAFPGGISDDLLPTFNSFLGLLVAQLMSEHTVGLFFWEARVFVPNTAALNTRLQTAEPFLASALPGAS